MLLIVAALPAAALSIASAIRLYSSAVALNNTNLVENAESVARRVEDEISEASKLARLLAELPGARADEGWCDPELRLVVENFVSVSAAALVEPDGTLSCSAGVDEDNLRFLLASAGGDDQLAIAGPVGALSVAIPGRPGWRLALAQPLASPIETAVDSFATGGRAGVIDENWDSVANLSSPPEWLPDTARRPDPSLPLRTAVTIEGESGETYRVALAPIRRSTLYAFAYRRDAELLKEETAAFVGAVTAPLLTIAFAVVAAWFGIDRLAIRWVVYLRRITDAYGGGRTSVRAKRLENAPIELAALGDAFDRMADAVGERTKAAEHQAEARGQLLRELHHRIKNNFQLIASLLSLQKREAAPEAAAALSAHERRVAAIAAAYRVSYAEGEVGPVQLAQLLRALPEIIVPHGERPWARIDLRLEGILPALSLDRAVPAALLITKLADDRIANAPGERAVVTISARACGDMVTIEIEGGSTRMDGDDGGLASRLRHAFVMQLGATIGDAEDRTRTTISIPVVELCIDPDRSPGLELAEQASGGAADNGCK
jgi:two-component sensor histidine kinase